MFTTASRLFTVFALLAGPAILSAQVKVTELSAASDVSAFYYETTWSRLRGLKRLTTPLVNLTFVTESGFRPAQARRRHCRSGFVPGNPSSRHCFVGQKARSPAHVGIADHRIPLTAYGNPFPDLPV
jgi:hypothetical protein